MVDEMSRPSSTMSLALSLYRILSRHFAREILPVQYLYAQSEMSNA
jgi:hypothetical protein